MEEATRNASIVDFRRFQNYPPFNIQASSLEGVFPLEGLLALDVLAWVRDNRDQLSPEYIASQNLADAHEGPSALFETVLPIRALG